MRKILTLLKIKPNLVRIARLTISKNGDCPHFSRLII